MKLLRVPESLPPIMPLDHIRHFFAAVIDQKNKAYFLTLYWLGSRPGETYNLKWMDIDFDSQVITFRNDTMRQTKTRKDRRIYLPEKLGSDILDLPQTSDRPFDQFSRPWQPAKSMTKYLEKAGLPQYYSPKYFRHTLATTAVATTKDQKGTQEILGHSSLAVTEIYTHYSIEEQKKILETIPDPTEII